jgi:hypothetical protein
MDAVGFLCVSLGSSTVQLYDSLGSRRACACSETGFSSRNGDRAWGVYCRRTEFYCAFLMGKMTHEKDIHKEMFHVYGGKCLSRKAVRTWMANVSLKTKRLKRRCGRGWDNSQKTSVSSIGHMHQCWWRVYREICVFQGSNITNFTFCIHLWPIYGLLLVDNFLIDWIEMAQNRVPLMSL